MNIGLPKKAVNNGFIIKLKVERRRANIKYTARGISEPFVLM